MTLTRCFRVRSQVSALPRGHNTGAEYPWSLSQAYRLRQAGRAVPYQVQTCPRPYTASRWLKTSRPHGRWPSEKRKKPSQGRRKAFWQECASSVREPAGEGIHDLASLFRAGYVEFGLLAVFAPRLLITRIAYLSGPYSARFRVEFLIAEKDCCPCPLGEDDLVQFLDEDRPDSSYSIVISSGVLLITVLSPRCCAQWLLK